MGGAAYDDLSLKDKLWDLLSVTRASFLGIPDNPRLVSYSGNVGRYSYTQSPLIRRTVHAYHITDWDPHSLQATTPLLRTF
jgi:hypothetical protein